MGRNYKNPILNELMQQIREEAKNEAEDYITRIEKQCVYWYKVAIIKCVYTKNVKSYSRTYQLINCVTSSIEDGVLYIYHDYPSMYYYSWVTGTNDYNGINVTENVPLWINEGHKGLHLYEAGHFVQYAKELIKEKLGIEVEVMYPPR